MKSQLVELCLKNCYNKNIKFKGDIAMYDIEKMLLEGRTIFPIVNTKGEVCGAIGRIPKMKHGQAKYVLRGNGFIGDILTEDKTIILTEFGCIDVLLSQIKKISNVIGYAGISMSDEDIMFFKEKDKNVILFFDQDECGRKAAKNVAERMKLFGINVYVFETDEALDMSDYLLKGKSVEDIMKIVDK